MIVVADTSPINYLVQIEAIDVLPRLFGRVIVPSGVWEELLASRTPEVVKAWLSTSHDWLEVRSSLYPIERTWLGRGEAQALQLALADGADLLLIDDKLGRQEADRLNIVTTGTIGVLVAAERAKFLDAETMLRRLVARTNFKCSAKLFQDSLLQIQIARGRMP